MQSILVLTDFSDTAFHAAEYACMLSCQFKSKRVILFNAYQTIPAVANEPMVNAGRDNLHRESLNSMEIWQESLNQFVNPGTSVSFLVDEVDLVTGVNAICAEEKIDMVVMGITGKSNLERLLIGSNAIRAMESVRYPLLIVPKAAKTTSPEKIILATDLKAVEDKINTSLLDKLFASLPAKLLVLNVAHKEGYHPELRNEISGLHKLLDFYNPEFHYITHSDTVEGINIFAAENQADLIITTHYQQSGLPALFHKSVSKKLAWHSQIPLLVVPVQDK